MKIKTQKNSNKKIIVWLIIILLLIGIGVSAYVYYHQSHRGSDSQSNGVNLKPATKEQKDAGDQSKSSTVNTDSSSNSSKSTGTQPSDPSSSNVNVQTSASAQNGATYQLRYLISSVENDATCTLTLTKGSSTVTKTAKTQALAQSSTCQGFDIPTSELSPGTWQAVMVVSGNNINGSASSTIQVQ